MKHFKFLFTFLATMMLALASCSQDNPDNPGGGNNNQDPDESERPVVSKLVGNWRAQVEKDVVVELTFNSDNTGKMAEYFNGSTSPSNVESFTYVDFGDRVILDYGDRKDIYEYKITNGVLYAYRSDEPNKPYIFTPFTPDDNEPGSGDQPSQASKLVGTWRGDIENGRYLLELTFNADNTGRERILDTDQYNSVMESEDFKYYDDGTRVTLTYTKTGEKETFIYQIVNNVITAYNVDKPNTIYTLTPYTPGDENQGQPENPANPLVGLWSGVEDGGKGKTIELELRADYTGYWADYLPGEAIEREKIVYEDLGDRLKLRFIDDEDDEVDIYNYRLLDGVLYLSDPDPDYPWSLELHRKGGTRY